MTDARRVGGVMRRGGASYLLAAPAWELAEAVRLFARRDDRSGPANRLAWAKIRALAVAAGARLDDFLSRSVVISLDKLDLGMALVEVQGTPVVELSPLAQDVPSDEWLAAFDRYSQVRDHYDLSLEDGSMVRVIPDEAVKEVLREIRRMPARRVAGRRAQAFLRNPYAVLGPSMAQVLPPERFEQLRRQAGIHFLTFAIEPVRDKDARIVQVNIVLSAEEETAVPLPPATLDTKRRSPGSPANSGERWRRETPVSRGRAATLIFVATPPSN